MTPANNYALTCRVVGGRPFVIAGGPLNRYTVIYRYASLQRTPLNQNTRYTRRFSGDGTLLLDGSVLLYTGIHDTLDTFSYSRPPWFNETPLYIHRVCTWYIRCVYILHILYIQLYYIRCEYILYIVYIQLYYMCIYILYIVYIQPPETDQKKPTT